MMESKGQPVSERELKIVFLDRDGVINVFPGHGKYVTKVKDFHFLPRALDAMKLLSDAGYTIFVVSNQAGVGRGVFSQDKLNRITRKMMAGVEKAGARIKKVYYCTHRPDAGCSCRKPDIGSVRRALKSVEKTLDSARKTYFVGDTKQDIETGYNAGCKTVFVLSGRENRRYMNGWIVKPDYIVKDLYDAAKIICGQNGFQKPAKPVKTACPAPNKSGTVKRK
ncbi:MAG TPA: HAD family hydrolase, partial [Candidatus Omnitrophota bacterium]|jgi:histidinol-phosphate phosphatase family protein|nr:HAD family hydrolase [Candidatus Omnitrophota bacterium]HPN55799.1 HAD family hydrolase [Candidatus Omnitrophota bacterium]